MTTLKDRQRVDAFRAWIGLIGGLAAAHQHTGIAMRSLERMRAGDKPPPVRLLDRAADEIERSDWGDGAKFAMEVAHQLRVAARPEATDA